MKVACDITSLPFLVSACGSLQLIDLAHQVRRLVRDDPLDGLEPVLDRSELRPEMRILLGQQFYPLHGFTRDFRFERLPERSFKRITMLHAEPSGEHPAEYGDEAKQHSAAD